MNESIRKSKILLGLVVIFDLIVLDVVILFLHFHFCDTITVTSSVLGNRSFFLIANLLYLITFWFYPSIAHMRNIKTEDIIKRVFHTVLIFGTLLFVGIVFINKCVPLWNWMVIYLCAIFAGLLFSRLVSRFILQYIRRMGRNRRNIVFIGGSQNMDDLYSEMLDDSSYGYWAAGYFNIEPKKSWQEKMNYLGGLDKVLPFLHLHPGGIDEIYCSLPSSMSSQIMEIVKYCEAHVIRFYSVPNVRNYLRRKMNMRVIGDVPVLYIHEEPLERMDNRIMKRLFDIIVSLTFLLGIFPWIFAVVAVVMKLTMPGPIFFKQKRNGRNGEIFYCYKFRSMKVNSDSDKVQATKYDPRKTKFGNLLRHTNIDELPQFFNVLIGDMSIVGPRPHMLKHTEQYRAIISTYMLRHFVKPGITGWAQVNGFRGETKELWQMEGRVKADVWYVENWSFWLDIRIIFMTAKNLIKGEDNAY